ncbi:hypothetical protein HW555_004876 [Spodoptera exigua]|uniref:Uncharacterized protein n=1 Tax=Spodoptera exigua TaxID=7107 RepID=A0A835GHI7_SPOEX|nr:hypothetical protein HW555_004876 [Spodoptera exigua]
MSQVSEIISIHKNVQESLLKRMGDIEAQIQSAGPAKDTVARIAEEFRAFRELVFDMLKMLRAQVIECCRSIDDLEMRSRRKAAIFQGMPELDNEDCSGLILGVINTKLGLDLPVSAIKVCHRLGASNKDHHRPILVKFSSLDDKASVWKAKTRLRGTKISIREFLTKPRQEVFSKARHHFGMRSCWTRDGNIFLKTSDGNKHRVTCLEELSPLLIQYPRAPGASQPEARHGAGVNSSKLKDARK